MVDLEVWKPIGNYKGLYEVSNFGNVRSLDKNRAYKNTTRNIKGKILKSCNCLGYKILTLSKDNIKTNYRVHRIVAEHFINNPDNKPYVNHIDGNKSNNHYSNLEWVTNQENINHALEMGLIKSGTEASSAKLTEDMVRDIRQMAKNNFRTMEIVRKYSHVVRKESIFNVLKNRRYLNVK